MPRPSRLVDQALLAAGRELFPALGCAGLTSRAVAARAGVRVAMLHYHFGSKDAFLRTLLQQLYEEMFSTLQAGSLGPGPALVRLRAALLGVARHVREHRRVLARLWIDAMSGQVIAGEFFRANAPRHIGLLFALLEQARQEGALRDLPTLQRFVFVMGSVMLPMIFAAGLVDAGIAEPLTPERFDAEVMSDAAIAERIDLALAALRAPAAAVTRRTRQ